MSAQRTLELILTATGGAEVVDIDTQLSLWASDSDEEFQEEFSETLDENDIDAVLDWLVNEGVMSDDEADEAEISVESIEGAPANDSEVLEGELLDDDEEIPAP